MMIRKNDRLWQEHLLTMDHLRSEVGLRAVGQRDPLMEFKQEAFTSFDEFGQNLRSEVAHDLFRFEIITRQVSIQDLLAGLQLETNRSLFAGLEVRPPQEGPGAPVQQIEGPSDMVEQPVMVQGPRVGRNDTCPCGSGKKYKKCCGLHKDDDEN